MTEIEGQITRLEGMISKANQQMRRINQDEGDDEKVDLLVKEIQTMKTQMFFLQQSILQMRTQDQLALEVAEGEVGPAYSSEMATDIARIATELEILAGRVNVLENQAAADRWVERRDFDIRNNALVERMDEIEDKVDNTRIVVDACEVVSESARRDIDSLSALLAEVSPELSAGWSTLIGRGPSSLCSDWLDLLYHKDIPSRGYFVPKPLVGVP